MMCDRYSIQWRIFLMGAGELVLKDYKYINYFNIQKYKNIFEFL